MRLFVTALLCALAACASCTPDAPQESDPAIVTGRWVEVGASVGNREYLHITSDQIIVHIEGDLGMDFPCYYRDIVEVLRIDGDAWTVRSVSEGEDENVTVVIRRDDSELRVEDEGATFRYEQSAWTDFTPLCE